MSVSFRLDRGDLVRLVERAARLDALEAVAAARGMPDTSAIVDFFEVLSGDMFDVPPARAIGYFQAKRLKPSFSYADMVRDEHKRAFTVAKMMDVDLLGQMRASLESALANGTPFKEWADSITPVLQSAGWWGRKAVIDPITRQPIVSALGSPWRLETIFRTNMQSAYAAGAWDEIESQQEIAPYLLYDAVDDLRTRPSHRARDNTVLRADDPWWAKNYPPLGWNCRCGVIQLDARQVKALGLTVNETPPKIDNYTWTNPRTGKKMILPDGIDPGFDRHPGKTSVLDLERMLREKIDALPQDMREAALSSMAASASLVASTQAKAAALIQKVGEDAADKTARVNAQAELDAIATGKPTIAKDASYKIDAFNTLKGFSEWRALDPVEQLSQVLILSGYLRAKEEAETKLASYKKVLDKR